MAKILSSVFLYASSLILLIPTFGMASRLSDSALTLLEPSSARSASLGEATTALANDVSSVRINPASLATLKSGQASFLYKKGLSEDTYAQVDLGFPGKAHRWGTSVAVYDGGTADFYDGRTSRTLRIQRDLVGGVAYARQFNSVALGLTGKIFSSQLAQSRTAQSMMFDAGMAVRSNPRFSWGASVQNIGKPVVYGARSERLPQTARLGTAILLFQNSYTPTLYVDGIFSPHRAVVTPAAGLEMSAGPMALRVGYRKDRDLNEVTLGTGFLWNSTSLDYAFGLVDHLSASHLISFSVKFGSQDPVDFVQNPAVSVRVVESSATFPAHDGISQRLGASPQPLGGPSFFEGLFPAPTVYIVQPGDTLRKIAIQRYGFERYWAQIYTANRHLIVDPENLRPGQRILLPKKGGP